MGLRLRLLRIGAQLSQASVAASLNVRPATLSGWEQGTSSLAALDVLRLADLYNMVQVHPQGGVQVAFASGGVITLSIVTTEIDSVILAAWASATSPIERRRSATRRLTDPSTYASMWSALSSER